MFTICQTCSTFFKVFFPIHFFETLYSCRLKNFKLHHIASNLHKYFSIWHFNTRNCAKIQILSINISVYINYVVFSENYTIADYKQHEKTKTLVILRYIEIWWVLVPITLYFTVFSQFWPLAQHLSYCYTEIASNPHQFLPKYYQFWLL